jgi:hypothetical protein
MLLNNLGLLFYNIDKIDDAKIMFEEILYILEGKKLYGESEKFYNNAKEFFKEIC